MGTVNYSSSGIEEVVQTFVQMSVQDFQNEIVKLPLDKLLLVISAMHADRDPSWKPKIRAAFAVLANRDQIETFGKALHYPQMLEILESILESDSGLHAKLLPLLVGLPNNVFEEILLTASSKELQPLKLEGITEPVQHHLTVMLHGIAHDIESRSTMLHNLMKEINAIDVHKVTRGSLDSIKTILAALSEFYLQSAHKISKALVLAWNTNRTDLIEKMTALKDSCLKYHTVIIGHPHSNEEVSTGFYALLDKQLDTVYGKVSDSPEDKEALDNSEPSIEGLARLGIWYLHDYWEIGLLPGIKEPEQIEKEGYADGDLKKAKLREKHYFLAVENLERLGLSTVGDLKQADIYSKSMLFDFIVKHRHQLKKES